MSKINYLVPSDQTPESRNDEFYREIGHDWQKRAKDLQRRRWNEIADHKH